MTNDEFERLYPVLDRLEEAHFFLHGLEDYYHVADRITRLVNRLTPEIEVVP